MNAAQLRAFHAVARTGSFTAAAKSLHVTQPAVTTHVKALESHYDIELFHRRARGCILSQVGEELLELTTAMFGLEEEADFLLASFAGEVRGTLRVMADGPFHSMGILALFHERYGQVKIQLRVGNSVEIEAGLRAYSADVAVLAGLSPQSDFVSIGCGQEPVALLVPAGHRFASKRWIAMKTLHGFPMIRRETGSRTQAAFDLACSQSGIKPNFMFEMGSREALREAVASGLGIGTVSLAEVGEDDRVRAVEIRGVDIHTQEFVVCLQSRANTRMVRAFMDVAAQYHGLA